MLVLHQMIFQAIIYLVYDLENHYVYAPRLQIILNKIYFSGKLTEGTDNRKKDEKRTELRLLSWSTPALILLQIWTFVNGCETARAVVCEACNIITFQKNLFTAGHTGLHRQFI